MYDDINIFRDIAARLEQTPVKGSGSTPLPGGGSELPLDLDELYQSFLNLSAQAGSQSRFVPAHDFGIGIPETELLKKLAYTNTDSLPVEQIRKDFPILQQKVNGHELVWFDNGATTQKPRQVIDAIARFYERDNSNIHRAAHTLAARSTDAYEGARQKVQHFINAASPEEIIFVRGTTEGINLVAQTFGRKYLEAGDEVIVSTLDHHANIVPWQQIAKEKGALLKAIPINERGELLLDEYENY